MHFQSVLFAIFFAAAGAAEPPAAAKLAWVNPARCLVSCTYDPGPALERVNDTAKTDPNGKHRVDVNAASALRSLLEAARRIGHPIRVKSAFRSYGDQAFVFRKMKEAGRAARPGHSEHQLGTAIDLTLPSDAAIAWLAKNAHAYGFAVSYPPHKQRVTGYRTEPWHVRFVGLSLAAELHQRGLTLEELFRERPGLGESGTCEDCPLPISRAACGSATADGSCRGNVLAWCYDGVLAKVDCSLSQDSCAIASGTNIASCVSR